MNRADQAAIEINERWLSCAGLKSIVPAGCPDDSEVAEIIIKHIPEAKQ